MIRSFYMIDAVNLILSYHKAHREKYATKNMNDCDQRHYLGCTRACVFNLR